MELINKRYKLIKLIVKDKTIAFYKSLDLNSYTAITLGMLNFNHMPQSYVNSIINEMADFQLLNQKYLLPLLDFGVVTNIDNKFISNSNYYYYCSTDTSTLTQFTDLDFSSIEDMIAVFSKVAVAIDSLNSMGLYYTDINLNNIYYKNNDIVLKHTFTAFLEKNLYNEDSLKDVFNPSRYYKDKNISLEKVQNFSLGVLLLIFSIKYYNLPFSDVNLTIFIENIVNNFFHHGAYPFEMDCRISNIIEHLIQLDSKNTIHSISELMFILNRDFGVNFLKNPSSPPNTLSYNKKLMGRAKEIDFVLDFYNSLNKYNIANRFMIIHGEKGIGKTSFISHICKIFKVRDIVSCSNLEDTYSNDMPFITYILNRFMEIAPHDVYIRYKDSFNYFINSHDFTLPRAEAEDNFHISAIGDFISEIFLDRYFILIIDDIHLMDNLTLKFLLYCLNSHKKNSRFVVILSYCDGYSLKNLDFANFLTEINDHDIINIVLEELDINATETLIKNILSTNSIPKKIVESIYDITLGNPLFIRELLSDLYDKNLLYFNGEQGVFKNTFNISSFKITEKFQNHLQYRLKDFSELELNLLSIISIFHTGISLKTMEIITSFNINILQESLNTLCSQGVLCEKIHDNGIIYDFYNKFLKTYLYDSMNSNKRENYHIMAFDIFQNYYNTSKEDRFLDYIIYHLRILKDAENLKFYCLKNAKRMLLLNNKEEAIKNYSWILDFYSYKDYDKELLNIDLDLCKLFLDIGKNEMALRRLKNLIEVCDNLNYTDEKIYILLSLIEIHLNRVEIEEAHELLKLIESLLDNYKDSYENLLFLKVKSIMYLLENNFQEALKTSSKGFYLCPKDDLKLKLRFLKLKFNCCIELEKVDNILPMLYKAYKNCSNDLIEEKLSLLNSIGIVYSDFYDDNPKALKYFNKELELAEKSSFKLASLTASVNIGFSQYTLGNYEKALSQFEKALQQSQLHGNYSLELYCCIYLGSIYYILGDYMKAFKYLLVSEDYIKNSGYSSRDRGQYYILSFNLSHAIGNFILAKDSLAKGKISAEGSNLVIKREIDVLYLAIYLEKHFDECNVDNVLSILEDNLKNIKVTDSILNFLLDLTLKFYFMGEKSLSKSLFYIINASIQGSKDLLFKGNLAKINILDYCFGACNDQRRLYELLEENIKENNRPLFWIILTLIGDYFAETSNLLYGIVYYYEACCTVIDMCLQLPERCRLSFIKQNQMLIVFKKFKTLISKYKSTPTIEENFEFAISDLGDLNLLFNSVLCEPLMFTDVIKECAKKNNGEFLDLKIHHSKDVFLKFTNITTLNMVTLLQYLCYIGICTEVSLLIEKDESFSVLKSTTTYTLLESDLELLNRCKFTQKPVIIKENYEDYLKLHLCKGSFKNIESIMVVPIILSKSNSPINFLEDEEINGYLLLKSSRILNNLNDSFIEEASIFFKVLAILIDSYYTRVNSYVDKLTSAFNRKYIENALTSQLKYSLQNSVPFSLLMLDVDLFKNINDKFGHPVGDEVLVQICNIINESIRSNDVLGRYGGEEFIIIVPDTTSKDAYKIAERIRKNIYHRNILYDKHSVSVSIGISNYPYDDVDYDGLIEKCDEALYQAKNSGRNKCMVWQESFNGNTKSSNQASTFITGNLKKDSENSYLLMDIINICMENSTIDSILLKSLDVLSKKMTVENIIIFLVKEDVVVKDFMTCKNNFLNLDYDSEIIIETIKKKSSLSYIERIDGSLKTSDFNNWYSILSIPVMLNDKVSLIICLALPLNEENLSPSDINLFTVIGKILLSKIS